LVANAKGAASIKREMARIKALELLEAKADHTPLPPTTAPTGQPSVQTHYLMNTLPTPAGPAKRPTDIPTPSPTDR
jgi:hypothetical protein